MTDSMMVIQARVPVAVARQVDEDAALLGLANRSAAIREALRLLHRQARHRALSLEYDDFYHGSPAPASPTAEIGDQIAAEVIAARESQQ